MDAICVCGTAEGEVDGEDGVVLSLEVGDVVAVDVVDDDDDGENSARPSDKI